MTDVFVPRSTARLGIDRKSGIVGRPTQSGRIELYFEGNRYGASNIKTFADRVYHAADRMQMRYPTIARSVVSEGEVIKVGWFNGQTVAVTNESALASWLGVDQIDPAELQRTRV